MFIYNSNDITREIFKFISDTQTKMSYSILNNRLCDFPIVGTTIEINFEHYTRSLLIQTKSDVIYS